MGLTNEAKAVKSASTSERSGITIVNRRSYSSDGFNLLHVLVHRIDQLQMLCALAISIEPLVEISRSGSSIARSKDVGDGACLVEYRHWALQRG